MILKQSATSDCIVAHLIDGMIVAIWKNIEKKLVGGGSWVKALFYQLINQHSINY